MIKDLTDTRAGFGETQSDSPWSESPWATAQGWEQLGEAMPDALIRTDAHRVIRHVNPGFTLIFGYSPPEILGKSALEIYARSKFFHEQGQIRFNPGAAAPSGPYETRYRRKGGEPFSATSVGVQVRDEAGRVIGFMLMVRDDARSREAASDDMRLATAVEQATENVVITDPQGGIEYVNPSFEKTTGYTRQEVLGQTPAILKSGAHDRGFYTKIWDTILAGEPWSGQIKNRRKDGSLYTEDCIITPVFSEAGIIINFVAVKHDITRTLALEAKSRQSQRIESLGRLAGGVAHDINNLLFPILGYTDILLEDLSRTSLMREPLEEIRKAGIKVRNLVRQLLAFSRRQTLEIGPLDLNLVIREFKKLMRKTVREDVEITYELADDLPMVMGDLGQVEQILMNLLVNAQAAMPGGGQIRIATGCHDVGGPGEPAGEVSGQGCFVYLRITDTGHGMDEQTRRQIFEPFFTTKEKAKGTGLGLATVYGIVKQHNGHIEVVSAPDKGADFTISLPRAEPSCQAEPEETACFFTSTPDRTGRVMLAEDNDIAMGFAAKALEDLGFSVVVAGNSRECVDFLETYTGSLDLLLSDVIMPGINGRELERMVSQKLPGVKTLFMSGYSHEVITRQGHLEKGLNFIAKPFSKEELSTKLAAVLSA